MLVYLLTLDKKKTNISIDYTYFSNQYKQHPNLYGQNSWRSMIYNTESNFRKDVLWTVTFLLRSVLCFVVQKTKPVIQFGSLTW